MSTIKKSKEIKEEKIKHILKENKHNFFEVQKDFEKEAGSEKQLKSFLSTIISDLDEETKKKFMEIRKENAKEDFGIGKSFENDEFTSFPSARTKKKSKFSIPIENPNFRECSPKITNNNFAFNIASRIINQFNGVNVIGTSNQESTIPLSVKRISKFNELCSEFKKNITIESGTESESENINNQGASSELNERISALEKKITSKDNDHQDSNFRNIFCKQKIYDSLSDEEEEISEEFFIDPFSKKKIFFEILIFLVTIVNILYVPVSVVVNYSKNGKKFCLFTFTFFGDMLYILDFIFGFFTGYIDKTENLIIKKKKICINYLCSWFCLDLMCAIPLGSYLELKALIKSCRRNSLNQLLKFIKFLKIIKYSNNTVFNSFFFHFVTSNIGANIVILLTICLFILIVHVLSSVYIIIALDYSNSWIFIDLNEQGEIFELFVMSYYYTFVTIFGVGYEIKSHTISERIYLIFLLIFGVFINTWLISSLSKLGNEFHCKGVNQEKIEAYKKKLSILSDIKRFYNKANNSVNVMTKVERFLVYNFKKQIYNSNEVLDSLPNSLRCELIEIMYDSLIKNLMFFKRFRNRDFVIEVITHFVPALFVKNDRIIHQGDFVEEMIFVKSGRLSVELPLPNSINEQIQKYKRFTSQESFLHPKAMKKEEGNKYDMEYVKLIEIRKNEHFGDIQMFLNKQTILSVRVSTKTAEIYLLKKTEIIQILNEFPEIWKTLFSNSVHNTNNLKKIIKKVVNIVYENNVEMLNYLNTFYMLKNYSSESDQSKGSNISEKENENKKEKEKDFKTTITENDTESQMIKKDFKKDFQPKSPSFCSSSNIEEKSKKVPTIKVIQYLDVLQSESEQNESRLNLLQKTDSLECSRDLSSDVLNKLNSSITVNTEFTQAEEEKMIRKIQNDTGTQSRIINKSIQIEKCQTKEQKVERFFFKLNSEKFLGKFNRNILKRRSHLDVRKKNLMIQKRTSFIARKSPYCPIESGSFLGVSHSEFIPTKVKSSTRLRSIKKNTVSIKTNSSKSVRDQVLLSIRNNIEDNSQNLHDPKSFYLNKFNDLIHSSGIGEKSENKGTFFSILDE